MKKKKKKRSFRVLPWRRGAKRHRIISAGTCEGTGGIIVGIAVGSGASGLEHLRVHRRPAGGGRTVRAAATVLRAPKRFARAPARAAVSDLQLRRTALVEIHRAARRRAHSRPTTPFHYHRQVVAIDEAHVVEVLPAGAESELRQCRRRGSTGAVAFDGPRPTVASDARTQPRSVKAAPCSPPEPTGPTCRSQKRTGSVLW